DGDGKTGHGGLEVGEVAGPVEVVSARQFDLLRHFFLRLEHGTAEVAAAHAEFHRDVALLGLAVDVEGAGGEVDLGNFGQRYLYYTAVGSRRADGDAPERLHVLAVARRQPHQHGEMPVAARLVEIARRLAADCRLDGGIDVAGREAVAGGALAVDVDADGGLAEQRRHLDVGDAAHLLEHVADLDRELAQCFQVGTADLDGIFRVDAGGRLLHIVLDVLREGEG